MDTDKHEERAARITRSLEQCTPQDYEMIIEGVMLAATDWVNYALHRWGLSRPNDDLIHTYMLTVNDLRKYRVADAAMLDALATIEDLRPLHVRGNARGGVEAGQHALQLLREVRDSARRSWRLPE